ncbi:MAG: glycosyltransferase, partial [Cytophagales bacterium]|nr:glycosyltransferase [Cytophaga sp.]
CVLAKPFYKAKLFFSRRVDFIPKGFFTLKKYNICDGIICVSEAIQTILQHAGVSTKTTVISDCIDPRELDRTRALLLLKEFNIHNKIIIGTTAALVDHKDPITLVKAIRILSSIRKDVVLIHFGDGPLESEVRSLIREYKIEDQYKLAGFKNNVEDYFSIFQYFVMSSREEGLGSSVLDAFVYKVSVISTNAGGLAELVRGRGYVTEKSNPALLAETLLKAIENPKETAEYIEAAAAYASSELTIEHIHEQYIRLFTNNTI